MSRHPFEQNLALYAGGDLTGWARVLTAWHVRGCNECGAVVEAFRVNRYEMEDTLADLPRGLDWDRLESEMTANIRLGLAAGECVALAAASARSSSIAGWNWRPAVAVAALVVVFGAAWLLNMPRFGIGNVPAVDSVQSQAVGNVVDLTADDTAGDRESGGAAYAKGVFRAKGSATGEIPHSTYVSWDGSSTEVRVDPNGVTLQSELVP